MKMPDVPDLLMTAIKCYSEGDFQHAILFTSASVLIMRTAAERIHVQTSIDRYVKRHFETLTVMGFQVTKDELGGELIFDLKCLTRLSNPPKVEVSKWMVWCMNDYVSLTRKNCKQFTEFKRSYLKLISQKAI